MGNLNFEGQDEDALEDGFLLSQLPEHACKCDFIKRIVNICVSLDPKVLRHSRSGFGGVLPAVQEVVLQQSRSHFGKVERHLNI